MYFSGLAALRTTALSQNAKSARAALTRTRPVSHAAQRLGSGARVIAEPAILANTGTSLATNGHRDERPNHSLRGPS
jgi:hypothetical protein